MIGAFLDGELAGFAGVHNDGGMGMLEVLEPFRKRGIGSLLEAEMIRRELAAGHVPYAHVFVENEISAALQKKIRHALCTGERFLGILGAAVKPGGIFLIRKKNLAYLRKLCYTANVAKKGDGPLLRESY